MQLLNIRKLYAILSTSKLTVFFGLFVGSPEVSQRAVFITTGRERSSFSWRFVEHYHSSKKKTCKKIHASLLFMCVFFSFVLPLFHFLKKIQYYKRSFKNHSVHVFIGNLLWIYVLFCIIQNIQNLHQVRSYCFLHHKMERPLVSPCYIVALQDSLSSVVIINY